MKNTRRNLLKVTAASLLAMSVGNAFAQVNKQSQNAHCVLFMV